MKWEDLAGPILNLGGTLVGGLLGAGPGAAVGSAIGGALATALGCDPTPEAVASALQTNPNAAAAVAAVDKNQGPSLQELDQQDRNSARQQTVQLVQAGSSIAWGAPVISTLVTIAFVMVLYIFMTKPVTMDANQTTMLNIILGTLTAGFTQVLNYWLGSSHGSAAKDNTISNALVAAGAPVGRAVENMINRATKK